MGDLLLNAAEVALPLSLAFLGVWLVLRTQNDFDLTVEGSFTTGAAVATLALVDGVVPWISLLVAGVAGGFAGALTYGIKRALGLTLVLTSIIVSIGLYSVNLYLLGRPNVAQLEDSVIADWQSWFSITDRQLADVQVMAAVVAAVVVALWFFLRTQVGLALRASGSNPEMSRSQGVSTDAMLLLALVIGNALTGLSGALVSQQQGFADVNMGVGTLVFGVTAVLLGDTVIRRQRSVGAAILAVLAGTFIYRFIIALAFELGLDPAWFRGLTAAIVIASIGGSRGFEGLVRLMRRSIGSPRSPGKEKQRREAGRAR